MDHRSGTYTAFAGTALIASGHLHTVVLALKNRHDRGEAAPLLVFDDESGRELDFDLRGSPEEVLDRLASHPALVRHMAERAPEATSPPPRQGPGRPRLGVVSREVSLLPRHWEWLGRQKGGASGTIRRLVDEARKATQGRERVQTAWEAAARFMWVMAGNLSGFEEASRALHRKEADRLAALVRDWPEDIRAHLLRLVEAAEGNERAVLGAESPAQV